MRAVAVALALSVAGALAAGALFAGCDDNPCVRLRRDLCASASPMKESGLCTRLRAEGDRPSEDLRKQCEALLAATK